MPRKRASKFARFRIRRRAKESFVKDANGGVALMILFKSQGKIDARVDHARIEPDRRLQFRDGLGRFLG